MNKLITLLLVVCLVIGGYFVYKYSSTGSISLPRNPFNPQTVASDDNFTGSDYKGNYVWGGAMNLAWNELSENIVKGQIKFVSDDKKVQDLARKFNSKFFTKNDLNEESYYIKSGFGQETVTAINKESKAKFPSKSFADLTLTLAPTDAIAYAYFLKEVEYPVQFTEENMKFDGKTVDAFYSENREQSRNIKVIKYWDENKFIISIQLKDEADQLIVAKGFNMDSPSSTLDEIDNYKVSDYESIDEEDIFRMPKLHLDMNRVYTELEGQELTNKINGMDARIKTMFENIKFDLDHKGARVENEGVIAVELKAAPMGKPKERKKMVLDKPFWVIMKRTNSANPYFTVGVNNTELMTVK